MNSYQAEDWPHTHPYLNAIRRAAAAHETARMRRDAHIRKAVAAGVPLRIVGEAANLSHTAVANIAKRDG